MDTVLAASSSSEPMREQTNLHTERAPAPYGALVAATRDRSGGAVERSRFGFPERGPDRDGQQRASGVRSVSRAAPPEYPARRHWRRLDLVIPISMVVGVLDVFIWRGF